MSRTHEEICQLLADKFKRESARLKSWGTKTDDKASLSFAMAVSRYVEALMAESRGRELKRLQKKLDHHDWYKGGMDVVKKYIQERISATTSMSKAIEHVAVADEVKRVWKPKVHKHKHGSHRSSRSSKH